MITAYHHHDEISYERSSNIVQILVIITVVYTSLLTLLTGTLMLSDKNIFLPLSDRNRQLAVSGGSRVKQDS